MFEAITYTRIRGLRCCRKYFYAASRPHVRCYAWLSICFLKILGWGDSHVIFPGSLGPSCEKNLCGAILSLHVQISLRVRSTVNWQPTKVLNLAGIKFGGVRTNRQTAKLNSPPNFPAIRYIISLLFDVWEGNMAGYCTLVLYFHSSVARKNTAARSCNIQPPSIILISRLRGMYLV